MPDEIQRARDKSYDKWRARPELDSPAGSLKIGVISDLHLGSDGTAGPLGYSEAFLEDDEMQQNLDLLVLNGDLIGKGLESYSLVEEFLELILKPDLVLS